MVQPFLQEAYIAMRDLKISQPMLDDDGNPMVDEVTGRPLNHLVVFPTGSKLPDAGSWPNLQAMIRTGQVERQRDADKLWGMVLELNARVDELERKAGIKPVAKAVNATKAVPVKRTTPRRKLSA
jgi:hypothetical protein